MFTAKTASGSWSMAKALWRFSMVIEISAGSAETDANAETVSPWIRSSERTVTMVTPAGKWRSAFRNSSDEITWVSSTSTCTCTCACASTSTIVVDIGCPPSL